MTRSARHSVTHAGLDEGVMDALDALAAAVAPMLAQLPASQRRRVVAAFFGCVECARAAVIDSYRIDAGMAMVKAVAHTCRLTDDVGETLRRMERDLERVEAISAVDRIVRLYPELAA